ncbi:DNA-binding beta-propeller fold protein YncE [Arachidicoccus rhizosphaerae]|uniref:DNA-binding beta-propeller fold protein YncE n=1 Tax=Arachidicoccus rhizosphaerae TaxID=551991 RepID=A0A1H3ZXE7_9BACT|nr:YncE family protein [Arachidicoccus rhizosphaerae]SEA28366.1 DNA-binding beta-propeller fold protein YncE [Arachidicoccus rhizosphaerae]
MKASVLIFCSFFILQTIFNTGTVLSQQTPVIAPASHHYLLALSKTDKRLVIMDASDFKIIKKLPAGQDPHEITVSQDGTTAYISNTGSGLYHTIGVVDLTRLIPLPPIDTRPLLGPHGLAYIQNHLYFTTQGTKTIGRYNIKSKQIDGVIGTGQDRTHMLKVSRDGKHIYATNVGSGSLIVLDYIQYPPTVTPMGYALPTAKPYWDWHAKILSVAAGIEGLDLSDDQTQVWTASPENGKVYIMDTRKESILDSIDANILGANRVRMTQNNKYVLISSLRTGDLYVFDYATHKLLRKIHVGTGASEVLIDKQDTHAFVACTPDNYIAVVDLSNWKVTRRIDIGGRPDGLSFADF